jgi:putative ABC transport system ATP-binding protein
MAFGDKSAALGTGSIGYGFASKRTSGRTILIGRRELVACLALMVMAWSARRLEQPANTLRLSRKKGLVPPQCILGLLAVLAIARALVNRPRLILADEPTGNLDTATSHEIMGQLARLNAEEKITIVLVTHEPDIAKYARRLVRFVDGHITHDGGVSVDAMEGALS